MEKEIYDENEIKKRKLAKISKNIAIICGFVLVICFIIAYVVGGNTEESEDISNYGATEIYVRECTEEFILRFYNLKYPDTFELQSIEYSYGSYEDKGYELWITEGRFTAQNLLGMEVNHNYAVFMQYRFSDKKMYALWIVIEDDTVYGSKENFELLYSE